MPSALPLQGEGAIVEGDIADLPQPEAGQIGGDRGDGGAGQPRIAGAADVQGIVLHEERRGEAVVRAEDFQGGEAGHQFDRRGRDKGGVEGARFEQPAFSGDGVAAVGDQLFRPARRRRRDGKQQAGKDDEGQGQEAAGQGHGTWGKPSRRIRQEGGCRQILGRLANDLARASSG